MSGKWLILLQLLNKNPIKVLLIFHIEKSGNSTNFTHPENIEPFFIIFFIFHFDISGNLFRYEHPQNKQLISITLFISKLYKSGNSI